MGTRGFIGFVVDGVEKISYNHMDSYPEALGVEVMAWAASTDLESAAKAARALRVVSDDVPPTVEDFKALEVFNGIDPAAMPREAVHWYDLLRFSQGAPARILACGYIEDASEFPMDSLFAEWGYIVNFDTSQLEVYRGFQRAPHDQGRFADRARAEPEYWPVKMVASYPLNAPDFKSLRSLD